MSRGLGRGGDGHLPTVPLPLRHQAETDLATQRRLRVGGLARRRVEGSNGSVENDERFAVLVEEFAGSPGVSGPEEPGGRRFGSSALKVNGSIFAMLVSGHLVVKLPRQRVGELIESGTGAPFDSGHGRPMKEWLTVVVDDFESWMALTRAAHEFVASQRK